MAPKFTDKFGRPLRIDRFGKIMPTGPVLIDQAPAAPAAMRWQFQLPPIEMPRALQADFDANPKLLPEFPKAIGRTLMICLQDRHTRPRTFPPSDTLLKEWVDLCYRVLVIMRQDMGFSLHRCLGILPAKVYEALRRGVKPEDHVEESQKHEKAWTPEHPAVESSPIVFDTEPVDPDSEPAKELLASTPEVKVE